jgi:hypothetical protein
MSNTRANRIARRYYGLPLSDLPRRKRRQVVEISDSTEGGVPHGLPPLPSGLGQFPYEEIMLAESIIDELDPSMLSAIRNST